MCFFALDLDPWYAGFDTQRAVFDWVRTSRLFHPACLRESLRREKQRAGRPMYLNFLQYVRDLEQSGEYANKEPLAASVVVAEARRDFDKEEEFDALIEANRRRAHLRSVFNGHLVMAWTGVEGPQVRHVMDVVRATVPEEDMMSMTREEVEAAVRRVYAESTKSHDGTRHAR